MMRLYLLTEGQTEETFVRELLAPHYASLGLFITPIIVCTSPGHKGGVTSYGKVKPQLTRLCRQDRAAFVSTLFDLYALPNDFPGKTSAEYQSKRIGTEKAELLEAALAQNVNEPNFIPFLMVHEFEALLFVQPGKFGAWTDNADVVASLDAMAQKHQTPEDINDDPQTAPSKRILGVMPEYEKPFHGPLIACDIGLDAMRLTCPHFNGWLSKLEQLNT
jgi:hypothetical protein